MSNRMKLKCKQCSKHWNLNKEAETAYEDVLSCNRKKCKFNVEGEDFYIRLLEYAEQNKNKAGMVNNSDSDQPVPLFGFMKCVPTVVIE